MGRLDKHLVYLSSGMDRVPDGGVAWRNWITPILQKRGIGVFNPCDKPIVYATEDENTRTHINQFKQNQDYESVRQIMKPICHADLNMVDNSHFLIVYLDTEIHLGGTIHELSLAIMQRTPTLIMCEQGISGIPNWWFGVVPHQTMFGDWDSLLEYVRHVDEDPIEEVDTLGRWIFYDWSKIYGK